MFSTAAAESRERRAELSILCRELRAADEAGRLRLMHSVVRAFQREVERLTARAESAEHMCEEAVATSRLRPSALSEAALKQHAAAEGEGALTPWAPVPTDEERRELEELREELRAARAARDSWAEEASANEARVGELRRAVEMSRAEMSELKQLVIHAEQARDASKSQLRETQGATAELERTVASLRLRLQELEAPASSVGDVAASLCGGEAAIEPDTEPGSDALAKLRDELTEVHAQEMALLREAAAETAEQLQQEAEESVARAVADVERRLGQKVAEAEHMAEQAQECAVAERKRADEELQRAAQAKAELSSIRNSSMALEAALDECQRRLSAATAAAKDAEVREAEARSREAMMRLRAESLAEEAVTRQQAAALAEECSSALEELLKQEQSVAESLRLALTHADEATADIAASAMAMRRGETHAVDEIRSAKAEVAQTAQKVAQLEQQLEALRRSTEASSAREAAAAAELNRYKGMAAIATRNLNEEIAAVRAEAARDKAEAMQTSTRCEELERLLDEARRKMDEAASDAEQQTTAAVEAAVEAALRGVRSQLAEQLEEAVAAARAETAEAARAQSDAALRIAVEKVRAEERSRLAVRENELNALVAAAEARAKAFLATTPAAFGSNGPDGAPSIGEPDMATVVLSSANNEGVHPSTMAARVHCVNDLHGATVSTPHIVTALHTSPGVGGSFPQPEATPTRSVHSRAHGGGMLTPLAADLEAGDADVKAPLLGRATPGSAHSSRMPTTRSGIGRGGATARNILLLVYVVVLHLLLLGSQAFNLHENVDCALKEQHHALQPIVALEDGRRVGAGFTTNSTSTDAAILALTQNAKHVQAASKYSRRA